MRDELHSEIRNFLNKLDFTDNGRAKLETALNKVWNIEEKNEENEAITLKNKITSLVRVKNDLIDKLVNVTSKVVSEQIEANIEQKVQEIDKLEERLNNIRETKAKDKEAFIKFALDFADNLANHFFELSPNETKECKLLLFPDGFFVDSENKVYTTQISPFYRLRETKKTPESVDFDQMVRAKRL